MRRTLLLLVAVLVALVAVLLIGSRIAAPPGDGSSEGDRATRPASGTSVPEAPAESPGKAPPASDDAPEGPRHRVVGRLVPAAAGARVTVIAIDAYGARRGGPPPVEGLVGAEGPFTLNVTPLIAWLRPAELEVRAEHPDHVPARARVKVEEDPSPGPDGVVEHPVEIALSRAAIVRGRVVDEAGSLVPGASVRVHRFDGSAPAREITDEVAVDGDGAYRLRADGDGRHLLVAIASGLAPVATEVVAVLAEETWAPDLVLVAGEAIVGRVLLDGKGVAGATVKATREAGHLYVGDGPVTLVWGTEGLVAKTFHATTGPDGTYRLGGLSRTTYRVSVEEIPDVHLHAGLSRSTAREVTAPASGVDLDLSAARLVLRVRVPAGAEEISTGEASRMRDVLRALARQPRYVMVGVRGGGAGTGALLGLGEGTLLLTPQTEHEVRVKADGFVPWRGKVVSPRAGEERVLEIELELPPPRPSLVVTFRMPAGTPLVERASFGLYLEGNENLWHPDFLRDGVKPDASGRFVLDDLRAGRYRLLARAGEFWNRTNAYFVPARAEVTVPEQGSAEVSVDVRRGGRLRVFARDTDGRPVGAHCRVLDGFGNPVKVRFLGRVEKSIVISDFDLNGDVPNEVNPALEAGQYRVELNTYAHRPVTKEVEVVEGRTTDVEVVLHRR